MLRVDPCPLIHPGRGRVVTGTISHFNGYVRALTYRGAAQPIETTNLHPFFSLDRNAFVRADDLRPGESVRTATGRATLTRKTARPGIHRVHNLEVERENVYYAGTHHILVHNGCHEAVEALGENARRHILSDKHNWSKVVKDARSWDEVSKVISDVLNNGTESIYKSTKSDTVYKKTLEVSGQSVEVTYIKGAGGEISKIGTAWVQ